MPVSVLFTVIVTFLPASIVIEVFSNLIEGTILTSGPAAADELAADDREAAGDELALDDREAAAVVVAVDLLSSLPQAAKATRLTARRAPIAMTLGNRRI